MPRSSMPRLTAAPRGDVEFHRSAEDFDFENDVINRVGLAGVDRARFPPPPSSYYQFLRDPLASSRGNPAASLLVDSCLSLHADEREA